MRPFEEKHLLLGVSGSIATFKAVALASRLVQEGATVDVIMTEAATKMVQPLSFQAITHRPVQTDMWAAQAETDIGHVTLAKQADAMLVAPATANTIAHLALGLSDNYLTTTALALRGPLLIAPAMETGMWEHPATQGHVETLRARGAWVISPEAGHLASGAAGVGRLASEARLLAALEQALGPNDLHDLFLVITAGGTREAIDPVRVVANRSSGRMGFALAEAAARRGASVVLIAGPTELEPPVGVAVQRVETAAQMKEAVLATIPNADALLMAAAVADFRPTESAAHKIKKGEEELLLRLERTDDILLAVKEAKRPDLVVIGWAAESENLIENARDKLERKALALVVANLVPQSFGGKKVQATLIRPDGAAQELDPLPKRALADRVLDEVRRAVGRGLGSR